MDSDVGLMMDKIATLHSLVLRGIVDCRCRVHRARAMRLKNQGVMLACWSLEAGLWRTEGTLLVPFIEPAMTSHLRGTGASGCEVGWKGRVRRRTQSE